ncbi:NYN domain-containing protein [Nocardioides limicola]|uniref:NYN domain-containing protein n=1 Tax=Nocardioides limicola TaxID=2803368 RepID=UPI00193B8BFE|nr:NYN domain-containing protein [Nocardioides sp. DJM-14]
MVTGRALPEQVRARLLALAAEALPDTPSLPPALRRVADFAPARRARLGGTQIAAALESDDEFRARLATRVQATHPELAALPEAADPVDVAAAAWLIRDEDWQQRFEEAVGRVDARAQADEASRTADELSRALRRVEEAERLLAEQRDLVGAQAAQAKAEHTLLRQRLGEARAAERAALARAEQAEAVADELARAQRSADSTADAEVRRWRRRAEEAEARLAALRRTGRSERDEATLRARLLLDTVLRAGAGLQRELGLPPVEGAPADRVEADLAEAGRSSTGVLGGDGGAFLEQHLALPLARLVIDGYNVTKGAWPRLPLEKQRTRLVSGLASLVGRTGAEATVVFDAAESTGRGVGVTPRGVRVLFSPEGVIADDVIRQLVAAEPVGRVIVVITDDQELATDVARAGATVLSAAALLSLL